MSTFDVTSQDFGKVEMDFCTLEPADRTGVKIVNSEQNYVLTVDITELSNDSSRNQVLTKVVSAIGSEIKRHNKKERLWLAGAVAMFMDEVEWNDPDHFDPEEAEQ